MRKNGQTMKTVIQNELSTHGNTVILGQVLWKITSYCYFSNNRVVNISDIETDLRFELLTRGFLWSSLQRTSSLRYYVILWPIREVRTWTQANRQTGDLCLRDSSLRESEKPLYPREHLTSAFRTGIWNNATSVICTTGDIYTQVLWTTISTSVISAYIQQYLPSRVSSWNTQDHQDYSWV